ncbi:fimbria/pilus periplasmic chaperone [Stenotrophomonas maltophilia]|nr:fimbria/pilus periplasmic chaperone [Stenotrophomonas maltophilia]MBN4962832.1 fimbria/pilus periplasmic chaperone [Stenotrophomonas maltophilia]
MFRLQAGEKRDIQIRPAAHGKLLRNRKSLLWLNILDVPPRQAGAYPDTVEIALRWRLKRFHRPTALAGTPANAPALLQWTQQTHASGRHILQAFNPTPYYVSLARLIVNSQDIALAADHAELRQGRWRQWPNGG